MHSQALVYQEARLQTLVAMTQRLTLHTAQKPKPGLFSGEGNFPGPLSAEVPWPWSRKRKKKSDTTAVTLPSLSLADMLG